MKRLAIFLDGTWNTLNNNTNVWRLKSLTAETAGQRVYYSQGVGTQRGEADMRRREPQAASVQPGPHIRCIVQV